jgi:hypothetical protein
MRETISKITSIDAPRTGAQLTHLTAAGDHHASGGQRPSLMGTEMGLGWTIALDQSDGSMATTLTNREGAFVFFGTCTTP